MYKGIVIIAIILASLNTCRAESLLDKMSDISFISAIRDSADFSFNKTKHTGGHVKLKSYDLNMQRQWAPYATLETSVDVSLNKDDLGVYQLRSQQGEAKVIQRFKMSEFIDIGAGFIYSAPIRYRANERDLELPARQTWTLNGRFYGWQKNHHIELELASSSWDATNTQIQWIQNNRREQRLHFSYVASF